MASLVALGLGDAGDPVGKVGMVQAARGAHPSQNREVCKDNCSCNYLFLFFFKKINANNLICVRPARSSVMLRSFPSTGRAPSCWDEPKNKDNS